MRGKEERGEGRGRRHPQFAKKQNVTEPDLRTASIPTPSDFLPPQTLFTVTIILPLFHSPFMSPLFISADWWILATLPTIEAARTISSVSPHSCASFGSPSFFF